AEESRMTSQAARPAPKISGTFGNLNIPLASNPMSSLSGAQFEADFPAQSPSGAGGREAMLLRQAQSGDRAAYGQIVVTYQDRLYNAVLRLVGDADEASEVTQEAFTRGLMKIESFRGEA